jgi:hypothetical protein
VTAAVSVSNFGSGGSVTYVCSAGRIYFRSFLYFGGGTAVTLVFLDVIVGSRIPFSLLEWVVFNVASILFAGYFGYLAAATSVPYSFTLDDVGVLVIDRSAVPGRPGRVRKLTKWGDLKSADMVGLGLVVITTSPNVFDPFYLIPEQAKILLLDDRCPLKNNLPNAVRERIGVDLEVNPPQSGVV